MRRLVVSFALLIVLAVAVVALHATVAGAFLILLLGIALREAWQSGKDWVEQRRNSISGDYVTFTTGSAARDASASEGKICRALRLDQRGKRVMGVETGEGKTQWKVSGEIYAEFVVGTWSQISPAASTNRGAFHLERDPQNHRRFQGQWIGWDPVKRSQGHGEWEWVRSAPTS